MKCQKCKSKNIHIESSSGLILLCECKDCGHVWGAFVG